MADIQKRIAKLQVVHTSFVALGATLLAVGITFFTLGISTIMTVSGNFTSNEIQHLTDSFFRHFAIFLISGSIIMLSSTILVIIAIQKLKTD